MPAPALIFREPDECEILGRQDGKWMVAESLAFPVHDDGSPRKYRISHLQKDNALSDKDGWIAFAPNLAERRCLIGGGPFTLEQAKKWCQDVEDAEWDRLKSHEKGSHDHH